MSRQAWTKFAKVHERSYTCADEDSIQDKYNKLSSDNDPRFAPSDSTSQQEQISSVPYKVKRKQIQLFQTAENEEKVFTPRPHRNMNIKGDLTTRTDRSQTEKTARELSRDLQKVQRIIQIDNDIIKSQLKNLNSDLKNKKDNLEVQNKFLMEKTKKLEQIVLEDRKEIMRFSEVFDQTVSFFKNKLNEQSEINNRYAMDIHTLKTAMKMMEINCKAGQVLEKSKRDPKGAQQKQKYIEMIRNLQNELNQKNNTIRLYQQQLKLSCSAQDHYDIKQKPFSFSAPFQCKQTVIDSCEQLNELCKVLLHTEMKDGNVNQLSHKLVSVVADFKRILFANSSQFGSLQKLDLFKKSEHTNLSQILLDQNLRIQ